VQQRSTGRIAESKVSKTRPLLRSFISRGTERRLRRCRFTLAPRRSETVVVSRMPLIQDESVVCRRCESTKSPCLTTARLGYSPHARCQNFSCPGAATHHVWYSLEGGPYSGIVLEAIATGFRAFDTANQRKHYVEEEVGAAVRTAIASGTVTQEDLFLQTKFTYQRGQDYRLPYDPDCDLTTQVRQSISAPLSTSV